MKRKILFISSLLISLVLAGGVVFMLFPNIKNIFGKKTQTIEISNPSVQQVVADTQSADQTQDVSAQEQQEAASQPLTQTAPAAQINQVAAPASSANPSAPAVAPQASSGKIVQDLVSWGFQKSIGRTIEAVIIHSSYNALGGDPFDFSQVVEEWKEEGVSPHYAIDRSGTIYQLVADQNIAYHAGVSTLPDGKTDVNAVSIGIEMINTETAQFTDAQYASLNYLLGILKQKYPIKYILGHDQIAPGRKTDPWNIDWSRVQK